MNCRKHKNKRDAIRLNPAMEELSLYANDNARIKTNTQPRLPWNQIQDAHVII